MYFFRTMILPVHAAQAVGCICTLHRQWAVYMRHLCSRQCSCCLWSCLCTLHAVTVFEIFFRTVTFLANTAEWGSCNQSVRTNAAKRYKWHRCHQWRRRCDSESEYKWCEVSHAQTMLSTCDAGTGSGHISEFKEWSVWVQVMISLSKSSSDDQSEYQWLSVWVPVMTCLMTSNTEWMMQEQKGQGHNSRVIVIQ